MKDMSLSVGVQETRKEDTVATNDSAQKDHQITVVAEGSGEGDMDPWKLPEVVVEYTPWKDLSTTQKICRAIVGVGKTLVLVVCLYFFICSMDLLSNAFRLIGGKTAGSVFKDSAILSNPVSGLMIGVLATSILQSSSTTTGIAISLTVAKVMSVPEVIPIVMGANIGTSVTNTLVSLGQVSRRQQFRRAFAGATVHDMFNWAAVIVLLPLEVATGYLYHLTKAIVSSMEFPTSTGKKKSQQFVKAIVKPFTSRIIQVDKGLLADVAKGDESAYGRSIIKRCCKKIKTPAALGLNVTSSISTNDSFTEMMNISSLLVGGCKRKCEFLFSSVTWSDTTVGLVLLVLTLVLVTTCFIILVKTLYSALRGPVLNIVKRFINADFPGRWSYVTGYVAIAIGTGITMILQSSSVFTSALTPLVGVGILSVERMYPLTLGANLGTTFTAIIVALSQSAADMPTAIHVALCHVFFNVSGILLFYPVPFMRIPIRLAKCLGNTTAKYRWMGIVYLMAMFVVLPLTIFGLSSISWIALVCVLAPMFVLIVCAIVLNAIQNKCPSKLPSRLRTWEFLPEPLRSLEPYDRAITLVGSCCLNSCTRLPCTKDTGSEKGKHAHVV